MASWFFLLLSFTLSVSQNQPVWPQQYLISKFIRQIKAYVNLKMRNGEKNWLLSPSHCVCKDRIDRLNYFCSSIS